MLKDPALPRPPGAGPARPGESGRVSRCVRGTADEIVPIPPGQPAGHDSAVHGQFFIRSCPEASSDQPRRLSEPARCVRPGPSGCSHPGLQSQERNFYIRAAIEDPRPSRATKASRSFSSTLDCQHLTDEIRRQHGDNTFVEGWALYGEEMMMREGLYPDQSPSRAGATVEPVSGRAHRGGRKPPDWSLDLRASGEVLHGGPVDSPRGGRGGRQRARPRRRRRRIGYMVREVADHAIVGRYRDREGAAFRLGRFHDQLISYGSLPLSIIECAHVRRPDRANAASQ